uniref:Uncharacterized protein n=1 Tax=Romanomermis culicivorax TaxID=13658 RepID=A0A915L9F5_ROMCU
MLNKTTAKISAVKPIPLNGCQLISELTLMILMANAIGDQAVERRPKEVRIIPMAQGAIFMKNTYPIYANTNFLLPWEQHIHYDAAPASYVTTPTDSSRASSQSLELSLALPALPSSSTITATALDM